MQERLILAAHAQSLALVSVEVEQLIGYIPAALALSLRVASATLQLTAFGLKFLRWIAVRATS